MESGALHLHYARVGTDHLDRTQDDHIAHSSSALLESRSNPLRSSSCKPQCHPIEGSTREGSHNSSGALSEESTLASSPPLVATRISRDSGVALLRIKMRNHKLPPSNPMVPSSPSEPPQPATVPCLSSRAARWSAWALAQDCDTMAAHRRPRFWPWLE